MAKSKKELFLNVVPKVEKALSDKRTSKKLIDHIDKWFDRNSEILLDTTITENLIFTADDSHIIFDLCGLKKEEIKEATNNSAEINNDWFIISNEIYIALLLALRYYHKAKQPKEVRRVYLYLSCRLYKSRWPRYFPHGSRREVMDYTINNLSNKFDIKRLGNFLSAMEKLADNNHRKYEKNLEIVDDYQFLLYSVYLYTRVNGMIKNIASEYNDNYKSKNYLNTQAEGAQGEGDDQIVLTRETDSTRIQAGANKYITKFVSSPLDTRMIFVAARDSDISNSTLEVVVSKIRAEMSDEVHSLVTDLLALYLNESKANSFTGIRSRKWVIFVLSQFAKTNTSDPAIINIKKILDEMLTKHCARFADTNREATRSAYRRALLFYLAYSVQVYI